MEIKLVRFEEVPPEHWDDRQILSIGKMHNSLCWCHRKDSSQGVLLMAGHSTAGFVRFRSNSVIGKSLFAEIALIAEGLGRTCDSFLATLCFEPCSYRVYCWMQSLVHGEEPGGTALLRYCGVFSPAISLPEVLSVWTA